MRAISVHWFFIVLLFAIRLNAGFTYVSAERGVGAAGGPAAIDPASVALGKSTTSLAVFDDHLDADVGNANTGTAHARASLTSTLGERAIEIYGGIFSGGSGQFSAARIVVKTQFILSNETNLVFHREFLGNLFLHTPDSPDIGVESFFKLARGTEVILEDTVDGKNDEPFNQVRRTHLTDQTWHLPAGTYDLHFEVQSRSDDEVSAHAVFTATLTESVSAVPLPSSMHSGLFTVAIFASIDWLRRHLLREIRYDRHA